jgi:hypothetical protein
MNRLFAYALLGLGAAQGIVACGDDDDSNPGNVSGSSGTATGGSGSAGKNTGGSATAGNAGKSAGGSGGSSGGTVSTGGTVGMGGDTDVGGEPGIGGAAGGDGGAGGDGAGGEPAGDPQPADPYWLSQYCDASSKMTLGCEFSQPWAECFNQYYHFLSGEGGPNDGLCTSEPEPEEGQEPTFPNLFAMIAAVEDLAAACPDTTTTDWRCTLEGAPQPKDEACAEARAAATAAYSVCFP